MPRQSEGCWRLRDCAAAREAPQDEEDDDPAWCAAAPAPQLLAVRPHISWSLWTCCGSDTFQSPPRQLRGLLQNAFRVGLETIRDAATPRDASDGWKLLLLCSFASRRTSCAEELRGRGSTFVAERWFGLPREDARPASFHHVQSTRFVNGTNPQQARSNMEAIAISTTDMAASAEYIPPLH